MGRKWANIVAKKTAKDGANSKVYAKFGVEIYVAAKKGEPDPELNTALRFVIDRAKQAQVPKHVIDKAIDKAKGNTDETFTEGRYEGFGPNGSMLIVDTLTSNVNRTAANVRAAFGKTVGTWELPVLYLTSLTTKVLLSLLVMMPMPSLSFCLKQMWMWMMSKQKKERSQSTLLQLIFTKQSLLCVNQVSKNSK